MKANGSVVEKTEIKLACQHKLAMHEIHWTKVTESISKKSKTELFHVSPNHNKIVIVFPPRCNGSSLINSKNGIHDCCLGCL